jgi:acetyl esterase/lipase
MSLKVKAMLATAVFSIGLFVNASPIWAEPQPLTIPSNGIVLQGKAKEKYAADYMKTYFQNIRTMKAPAPFEAPAGWKMETVTVNGITLERMTADQKKSDRVLLQMHGGGYVGGMSNNHRILGLRQATLADAGEVYFVNYRLAPAHVYPAALEDAVAVYKELLNRGIKGENIILTGDSAGGNLAVELALYLKENKLPQPGVIALASPWTTFEHKKGTSRYYNDEKDVILGKGTPLNIPVKDAKYKGKLSRKDPRLSPIYADLSGLPPMLIQAGGNELFLTESVRLAEKAAADGTTVTLTVYPGMSHDFALLLPEMQDSIDSLKEIADFANRYMK